MKYYILINSDDGFIVEEVDGKSCKFDNSLFIYKYEHHYCLVDKATGLIICRYQRLNGLENYYNLRYKERYEIYKKTDAYKIKVERFEKMKLSYNYKGVK